MQFVLKWKNSRLSSVRSADKGVRMLFSLNRFLNDWPRDRRERVWLREPAARAQCEGTRMGRIWSCGKCRRQPQASGRTATDCSSWISRPSPRDSASSDSSLCAPSNSISSSSQRNGSTSLLKISDFLNESRGWSRFSYFRSVWGRNISSIPTLYETANLLELLFGSKPILVASDGEDELSESDRVEDEHWAGWKRMIFSACLPFP